MSGAKTPSGKANLNTLADLGAAVAPNPVLFEEGDWRLYGHIDDEFSTMAHKCPKWADEGSWGDQDDPRYTEWRWYWGDAPCGRCHNAAPEQIRGVYLLHNFDRVATKGI